MALTDIRIMAGNAFVGGQITNYLSNSSGAPTAGGAATAASTTPFAIRDDQWTMQDAPPAAAFSGGPPFRNGSMLAYQSFPNTVQSIPIAVEGSSHDNAASLLRDLRRLINQSVYLQPAILYYQPANATNPLYYNILSGYVQERPSPLSPIEGFSGIEADLFLTLAPFGGLLSTPETLLNAVSFGNNGTGSPDDVVAYSAGAGDMIFEGSPLNLTMEVSSAGTNVGTVHAASIAAAAYAAGVGAVSTSSTSAVLKDSYNMDLTTMLASRLIAPRFIARVTSPASNAELQIKVVTASTSSSPLYTSPWIRPGSVTTFIDFGTWSLDALRLRSGALSAQVVVVQVYLRSTNGSSASVTLSSYEALSYYTYCIVQGAFALANAEYMLINTFREETGAACLPAISPVAFSHYQASNAAVNPLVLRGQPPLYFKDASLWLTWVDSTGQWRSADTAVVTAKHAPLWHTMRGAG